MFVDEADFDEDDIQDTYRKNDTARPAPAVSTFRDFESDDDDDFKPSQNTHTDGAGGGSNNSRARMLAQQREIQMKKRQSSVTSGGMVRSSIDSTASASPMRKSGDNQFTPAIRQFSAPKALRSEDNVQSNSEFGSRGGGKAHRDAPKVPVRNKYSDEEDDGDRDRNRRGHNSRRGGDDDDDDSYRKHGSSTQRGGNRDRGRASYDDEEDESYQWGGERSRGGGNGRDHRDKDRDRDRDWDRDRDRDRDKDRNRTRDRDSRERGEYAGGREQRSSNNRDNSRERGTGNTGRGWQGAGTSNNSSSSSAYQNRSKEREAPVDTHAPAPATAAAEKPPVPPDLSDIHKFMTTPLPKECGVIQCYIRRNKSGTNKLYPIYSLYLKEGDVFLLASKKRPKNKTSNYLISMDQNDLNRSGSNYLGKLRSNFVGTEFQVFDNGENPKDVEDGAGASGSRSTRSELGVVMYAANVLGSRGPRKMQVAIPGLDEEGRIIKWKDTSGHSGQENNGDDMMTRMKDRNFRDLIYLINKPPRWNDQVGAYVLNFNGRVTMASVKNFQLVDPDEQNSVVLQFGRVGKDDFTMDMQWPISPLQAFGITLSSFDSKIACD